MMVLALVENLIGFQHDYVRAAEVLRRRALLPDSLPYFGQLATRLLAASGQYEASRDFSRLMRDSAPDDATRAVYDERLRLIDLEETLGVVEAADERYFEDVKAHASTIDELMLGGYLVERPLDPFGGNIVLKDGHAASTAKRRLEVYGDARN